MLINRRCTVCQDDIEGDDLMVCGECGREIHADCVEFEQQFDCHKCAEELEIGIVEF